MKMAFRLESKNKADDARDGGERDTTSMSSAKNKKQKSNKINIILKLNLNKRYKSLPLRLPWLQLFKRKNRRSNSPKSNKRMKSS